MDGSFIITRFKKDNTILVETTFQVEVKNKQMNKSGGIVIFLVVLIVGYCMILKRKESKKK